MMLQRARKTVDRGGGKGVESLFSRQIKKKESMPSMSCSSGSFGCPEKGHTSRPEERKTSKFVKLFAKGGGLRDNLVNRKRGKVPQKGKKKAAMKRGETKQSWPLASVKHMQSLPCP